MDISAAVLAFRGVIAAGWECVSDLAEADQTGSLRDDWLQANWEMIVENSLAPTLKIILEPYGEGADCNVEGSRVSRPHLLPTHRVICFSKGGGQPVDVFTGEPLNGSAFFDRLCTRSDNWAKEGPPFDHVAIQDIPHALLKVDDVTFSMVGAAD